MTREATQDLSRVCVKLYAPEPHPITRDAELFVPIFHEWIRDQRFDMVLFDVSDYAHAPDSPGIMLGGVRAPGSRGRRTALPRAFHRVVSGRE
jgi:hypothetical protein